MTYDIPEHLKPHGLTSISDERIEQHWHLYEAYVEDSADRMAPARG